MGDKKLDNLRIWVILLDSLDFLRRLIKNTVSSAIIATSLIKL